MFTWCVDADVGGTSFNHHLNRHSKTHTMWGSPWLNENSWNLFEYWSVIHVWCNCRGTSLVLTTQFTFRVVRNRIVNPLILQLRTEQQKYEWFLRLPSYIIECFYLSESEPGSNVFAVWPIEHKDNENFIIDAAKWEHEITNT